MHGEPAPVRDLGERADLVRPIDGAGLGRLGERQHRRAHVMRAAPLAGIERALQGRGRDLAACAREPDELDAAAEEFRRAAFIRRDMRLGVAEHGAPGRREMRERQRVGRGPGRHQEYRDLVLEQLGEPLLDVPGPGVAAIGERRAVVGATEGGEDVGCDAGRVVAGEVHGSPRQ
jgi:hypothetical protein